MTKARLAWDLFRAEGLRGFAERLADRTGVVARPPGRADRGARGGGAGGSRGAGPGRPRDAARSAVGRSAGAARRAARGGGSPRADGAPRARGGLVDASDDARGRPAPRAAGAVAAGGRSVTGARRRCRNGARGGAARRREDREPRRGLGLAARRPAGARGVRGGSSSFRSTTSPSSARVRTSSKSRTPASAATRATRRGAGPASGRRGASPRISSRNGGGRPRRLLGSVDAVVYPSEFLRRRHAELFPGARPGLERVIGPPMPGRPAEGVAGEGARGRDRVASATSPSSAPTGGTRGRSSSRSCSGAPRRRVRGPSAGRSSGAEIRRCCAKARRLGAHVVGHYRAGGLPRLLRNERVDVALLLSIWPETFGLTLSECRAAGVPVIAFEHGAIADRVAAEGGGLLVPPDLGADGVGALLERLLAGEVEMPAFRGKSGRSASPASRWGAEGSLPYTPRRSIVKPIRHLGRRTDPRHEGAHRCVCRRGARVGASGGNGAGGHRRRRRGPGRNRRDALGAAGCSHPEERGDDGLLPGREPRRRGGDGGSPRLSQQRRNGGAGRASRGWRRRSPPTPPSESPVRRSAFRTARPSGAGDANRTSPGSSPRRAPFRPSSGASRRGGG